MSETKTLEIRILGDASSAEKALRGVGTVTESVGKRMGVMGAAAASFIGNTMANAVSSLASAGASAIKQGFADAQAYQDINRVVTQLIETTGGAANVTAKQVRDLSSALEDQTGIDETLISKGQSILLTYTNIKNAGEGANAIFDRSTQAALDLSTVFGTAVPSAANMMGKALNDPTAGLSALTRVGVSFTEQQKEQIKALQESGDVLGAQKVMLKAIEGQVAGASQAANKGFTASLNGLKDTVGDVFRGIALKLMPVLSKAAKWLSDEIPKAIAAAQKWFNRMKPTLVQIGHNIRDAFEKAKPILVDFMNAAKSIGETLGKLGFKVLIASVKAVWAVVTRLFNFLTEHGTVTEAVAAGIFAVVAAMKAWQLATTIWSAVTKAAAAVQAAFNAVMAANPIGLVALAIIGLVAAVVVLYKKNEAFRTFIQATWAKIKGAVSVAIAGIKAAFSVFVSVIKVAWKVVSTVVGVGVKLVVGYFKMYWKAVQVAWNVVKTVFRVGVAYVKAVFNTYKAIISGVWNFVKTAFTNGVNAARAVLERLVGFFTSIWGRIVNKAKSLVGTFLGIGKDIIGGVVQGIKDTAGDVIDTIKEYVTDRLPGFVKKALGIESPSKVFAEIGKWTIKGLSKGIKDESVILKKDALDAVGKVVDAIQSRLDSLKSKRQDLFQGIKDNLTGFANASGLIDTSEGADNSGSAVAQRYNDRLQKIKAFMANINRLGKKGLAPALLREVMSMGAEEGLALSQALLNDPATIGKFNAIQQQIDRTTSKFAGGIANEKYRSDIRSTQRDLTAAERYQKRLRDSKAVAYTVNVNVAGNVTSERDLVKAITPIMRDELKKIEKRNAGRAKG